jgi:hypothetical protein
MIGENNFRIVAFRSAKAALLSRSERRLLAKGDFPGKATFIDSPLIKSDSIRSTKLPLSQNEVKTGFFFDWLDSQFDAGRFGNNCHIRAGHKRR